jgi:tryptophan synthase alpha chain
MNRIQQAFNHLKNRNQKAFIPYIMAGDGGLNCLTERLQTLESLGVTAVEVGIPFSDPVADGPTIQRAGIRALHNGTNLTDVIKEVAKARKTVKVPLLLMTYLNPVYSYGIERFVQDSKVAGIDGCIIPDLPIEEEAIIAPQLAEAGIELIRLVTMTTPMERIKGITGVRHEYDQELAQFLKSVKEVSPIPVMAGFGISNEDQVKELASYCDGVIVGSKIVELFEKDDIPAMKNLINVLHPEQNVL